MGILRVNFYYVDFFSITQIHVWAVRTRSAESCVASLHMLRLILHSFREGNSATNRGRIASVLVCVVRTDVTE